MCFGRLQQEWGCYPSKLWGEQRKTNKLWNAGCQINESKSLQSQPNRLENTNLHAAHILYYSNLTHHSGSVPSTELQGPPKWTPCASFFLTTCICAVDLLPSELFLERGGTRSQICWVDWLLGWHGMIAPYLNCEWHPGKYHLLQMFLAHSEQHLKYQVSNFYAQKMSVNTIAAIHRLKELGWGLQCLPSCRWEDMGLNTPKHVDLKTLFSHPRLLISGMFKLGQRPLQADTRKFIFLKTLTKSGNVLTKMLLYTP